MNNVPTVERVWFSADSTAYNAYTGEYFARLGEWGAVIPEHPETGEPDFTRGAVSPLKDWAVQDF